MHIFLHHFYDASPWSFLTNAIQLFRDRLSYGSVKKQTVIVHCCSRIKLILRCSKAMKTRTNAVFVYRTSSIVNFEEATDNYHHSYYFSGLLPTCLRFRRIIFLEITVKQYKHLNGTRDILLLWVPLQHPLQLRKELINYHCNNWEIIWRLFTFSPRLLSFFRLLTVVVSVDY